jgi:hypothetical protein
MNASPYPHAAGSHDGTKLGAVPAREASAQSSQARADIHSACAHRECRVFHRMLLRLFPVPEGIDAAFVERPCPNGAGEDLEVCLRYDPASPDAVDFVRTVQLALPRHWDAIARYELAWLERRDEFRQGLATGRLKTLDVPAQYALDHLPWLSSTATFDELLMANPL